MDKRHYLVTAGTTREPIDSVRVWSNVFTGKTGLDIALELLHIGDVTLLTSNERHFEQYDGYSGSGGMLGVELFASHADLKQLLAERMGFKTDGVFMTAAVSDYSPAGVYRILKRETRNAKEETGEVGEQEVWVVENVHEAKVKSSHGTIAIMGKTTEKLVDLFRTEWGFKGLLVKFKLQAGINEEELIRIATASRMTSGADYIVANTMEMVGGAKAGAYIIGEGTCERVERAALARRLRELAVV